MKHLGWIGLLTLSLLMLASELFACPERMSDLTNEACRTTVVTTLVGDDVTNDVKKIEFQFEYETVAASQTDQVLGTTGSAGDLLHALHCVWTAASAAGVSIKDGTGSSIPVFETKSSATSQTVTLDMVSADAGWKITTSTNTTCIGIGRFN